MTVMTMVVMVTMVMVSERHCCDPGFESLIFWPIIFARRVRVTAAGIEVPQIDGRRIPAIQAVVDHDQFRFGEAADEALEPSLQQKSLMVPLPCLKIGIEQHALAVGPIAQLGGSRKRPVAFFHRLLFSRFGGMDRIRALHGNLHFGENLGGLDIVVGGGCTRRRMDRLDHHGDHLDAARHAI